MGKGRTRRFPNFKVDCMLIIVTMWREYEYLISEKFQELSFGCC